MIDTTVVTFCNGRLHYLKQVLHRWFLQDMACHVVVVDYGCPDGTAAYLREHYQNVQVVEVLVGIDDWNICHARNAGVCAATTPYVLMMDSDVIAPPDAVRRFTERLRQGADLVCVANYEPESIPLLNGQCAFTRDLFHRVRGYDESQRGYCGDDGDFYERCRIAGARIDLYSNLLVLSNTTDERFRYFKEKSLEAARAVDYPRDQTRTVNPDGYGRS